VSCGIGVVYMYDMSSEGVAAYVTGASLYQKKPPFVIHICTHMIMIDIKFMDMALYTNLYANTTDNIVNRNVASLCLFSLFKC